LQAAQHHLSVQRHAELIIHNIAAVKVDDDDRYMKPCFRRI
jgi:hypothetical protein